MGAGVYVYLKKGVVGRVKNGWNITTCGWGQPSLLSHTLMCNILYMYN